MSWIWVGFEMVEDEKGGKGQDVLLEILQLSTWKL